MFQARKKTTVKGTCPSWPWRAKKENSCLDIDNVIQANLAACLAPKTACGKVVNIAFGERVSLLDILENVYGLAGKRVLPKFEPARVGDVRDSLADISLARDLIGYDPKVPFPEGLAKTFDWLRSTPEPG
jgi:nucleoside-diphosphate-sugar epimerase